MPTTTAGRPAAMSWRVLTALAVLASAFGHWYAYAYDGWDFGIIGVLFVVNMIAGVVIAIATLVWRHWIPLFLAFGFSGVTLVMFLIAKYASLFGVQDRLMGFSQWLCLIAEAVGLVVAAGAFFGEKWLSGSKRTSAYPAMS
jgi:hypothetical protein